VNGRRINGGINFEKYDDNNPKNFDRHQMLPRVGVNPLNLLAKMLSIVQGWRPMKEEVWEAGTR
jgi:hypothetical protein